MEWVGGCRELGGRGVTRVLPLPPNFLPRKAAVWDKTGPIRTLPAAPSQPCSLPKCHSCSWQGRDGVRLTTVESSSLSNDSQYQDL